MYITIFFLINCVLVNNALLSASTVLWFRHCRIHRFKAAPFSLVLVHTVLHLPSIFTHPKEYLTGNWIVSFIHYSYNVGSMDPKLNNKRPNLRYFVNPHYCICIQKHTHNIKENKRLTWKSVNITIRQVFTFFT